MTPRAIRFTVREPFTVEEKVLNMCKNMRVFCIETLRSFQNFEELAVQMEETKSYFLINNWLIAIKSLGYSKSLENWSLIDPKGYIRDGYVGAYDTDSKRLDASFDNRVSYHSA
jgi:hypothetical protein